MSEPKPRLYAELASWWPALSPFQEYAEEAAFFRQTLLSATPTQPHTLLELGSGGGSNAYYLKKTFQMTLIHCKPGGAALFVPDCVTETFTPDTDHGGHDLSDRALRYLEWSWDPDPGDSTFFVEYAYVLREPDGRVHCEYDRHVVGLFKRADWMRFIREAGFEPREVAFTHSEAGKLEAFIGVKAATGAKG
jgi:hypothetical protein